MPPEVRRLAIRRKITDLREKRASLYEQMKEVLEAAGDDGLSAEDAKKYDALEADFDAVTRDVERLEKVEGIAPSMTRDAALDDRDAERADDPNPNADLRTRALRGDDVARREFVGTDEYADAWESYVRNGFKRGTITSEQRAALQVGTDSEGGYTVPDVFLRQLLESKREFGVIDGLATHFSTSDNGQVTVPTVATYGTSVLTAEEAAFTESEDTFGQKVFDAYKYGRIEKISDELVTDSAFDILGVVARLAGTSLAIVTGTAFATGDGSGKPNGIFTAATTGVTAASNAAITGNELIDLYHSVLSPYRANSVWVLRDSTAAAVRKLVDGNSQYLWQPGLQAGQPDTLLGRPVHTDPNAPAIATVADSVLFGDVSAYWIRDVEGTTVKVLDELYAANGQVGFRIHMRTDGDLVDASAVKVLTHPV